MKQYFLFAAFVMFSCGDKTDEDETDFKDSETDGIVPGCGIEDQLCFSFWGDNYNGQEEANCTANSDASVARGEDPYELFTDGCQDGAVAECTGLVGLDSSGQPVTGSEYTIYFYVNMDIATAQGNCENYGGTFTQL